MSNLMFLPTSPCAFVSRVPSGWRQSNNLHRCLIYLLSLCGLLVIVFPALAASTNSKTPGYVKSAYVLPPNLQKTGLKFCGEDVPLKKRDVYVRISDQLNFLLMDRRALLMEWFDRMNIFGPAIVEVLSEEELPHDLLYVSVLLSGLTPNARLKKGGVGWWSLGTSNNKKNAQSTQWLVSELWDDRRDFVLSTQIASKIFKELIRQAYFKSWPLAISAFLDGHDKLEALVKKFPGFSYWDLVMPPLSDAFIPQVVALKIIDTNREFYSLQTPPLKPASYDVLAGLILVKDLPLYVVARWCHISPRGLWELNPGVEITGGMLPKTNPKNSEKRILRVPKGKASEIKSILVKEGYLASSPP